MLHHSLTIARIATIPVRVHWSWAVVALVLMASFSPLYVERACNGPLLCAGAWAMAALMTALISASVLLHELGHALVAHRFAVPVESITLFAFGGMAEVQSESPGPQEEFAIAIAGPLSSLLLAVLAAIVWWGLGSESLVGTLALHLALANGVMALFNLLPGYPMDGGRVLRATLWFLNDELLPATRASARVGRIVASLIMVGGMTLAISWRMPLLAIWALIIGGFLHRMARTGYRQLMMQTALHSITVADLMQERLRTVPDNLSVEQFVARYLLGQSELGFAVVPMEEAEQAQPTCLGMITLRQIRRYKSSAWATLRIGDVLIPLSQSPALQKHTPALEGLYRMNAAREEQLPVVEQGRLCGMLTRRDLAVFIQVQLARRR
jgi:Zn-dependent protease/CBS domain-containing protein